MLFSAFVCFLFHVINFLIPVHVHAHKHIHTHTHTVIDTKQYYCILIIRTILFIIDYFLNFTLHKLFIYRNLLNQIVQIKLNHYELSKIRSQTPEDYLKTFFEQELKPLWPQGWMQSRMLFKESRAVHQCWTNPRYCITINLTTELQI